MVDLQAAASLLTSLRAMGDISRAMIGLRDAEVMREKVIELQQIIIGAQQAAIDAQSAQADLKEQIRDLKDQLRRRVSLPCPICGQELKTTKVIPDRVFGDMGVQEHTLVCACGHTEERQVDPSKR